MWALKTFHKLPYLQFLSKQSFIVNMIKMPMKVGSNMVLLIDNSKNILWMIVSIMHDTNKLIVELIKCDYGKQIGLDRFIWFINVIVI